LSRKFCVAFRTFVGVWPSPDLGEKANDEICDMSKPVVEVQVRAVAAVSGGCAVFLGNEDKVFVMFVDQSVGQRSRCSCKARKRSDPSPMIC
jgi:hypothetical protein